MANSLTLPDIVVDHSFVAAHRDELVICDVRWYLDRRSGRAAYEAGHIAGALFVDLDQDLSDPPAGELGRHPFPSPARFAESLGALGIAEHAAVIGYDDTGGATAGRLVWMLRAIGQDAAVLDGGLSSWREPLQTGAGVPRAEVRRTPHAWPLTVEVDANDLLTLDDTTVLLDARAADRYRGEIEPTGAPAGHIPGARNLPWNELLDEQSGGYASPAELRKRLGALGITDASKVIASCGSGVSACAVLVGIERAGLGRGRLFVPSYSGWTAAGRQVETGDDRSR